MTDQTRQHIVGLEDDKNIEYFNDDRREFKTIRVVVHLVSESPTGLAENHVSVFLLIRNTNESVRLNMKSDMEDDDIKGYLVWTKHDYMMSSSALTHKDYELGQWMQVRTLYSWIRYNWFLHRYDFSGGGSGCRFWV